MDKTTVLIVEDEAIVAADLAGKLGLLGYEVVGTAASGKDAVDLACSLKPEVVLMDIRLQGPMDGIEAAEEIGSRFDVPLIYLTAHSDTATLDRAKLSGPFGYILKPFEERELSTTIEMALYKHQSDRQLREQKEWLRVTLASIGDAVITCDTDGRITFLNAMAEALTGWSAEDARDLPIGEVFRLINEETRGPAEDIVTLVLRDGQTKTLANHTALVMKDGREVPIEDSAAPILAADGRVIGAVIVFHDVTEKRRAQEALRRSHDELERCVGERTKELVVARDIASAERQRLYDVLETLPVYVVLLSSDYHVPFANRFFRERFGESQGRRCYEYLFNRTEPCEICETYSVLKSNAPHHWYWTGPDGRDYDIYDYPFVDSDGSAMILEMGIDITEQRQAQKALTEMNEAVKLERQRLYDVLETLPAMICLLTPDYQVAFANKAFRDRFGESHGRHCYDYCFGKSEPCDFCESYKVLETGRPHHWEVTGEDGSVISAHDYPFTDVDGSQLILEMDIDITEQRMAEKALRELNETLEEQVLERTAQLKSANEKLRDSHRAALNLMEDAVTARKQTEEAIDELRREIGERKQAEASLRQSNQRLDLLYETAGRLLASDSPQLVVNELCGKVMDFLDCHAFFNFLVEEETGCLRLNACAGIPVEEKEKIEWLDYGTAVCGCAARDACRIVAEDIPNTPDPRTDLVKSYGILAYACHPLMARERVLGTLSFGTRGRPRFSDDDLSLMKAVANQVAIAVERKRVEEELRQAKEAAEAANRAKSRFLANMSHELRTPLTGVLGMLDFALVGPLDAQQSDTLGIARRSAGSLLQILNDILDLSRIEAGKFTVEEKSFHLRECISAVSDIFIPEAKRKGLEYLQSIAADVPENVVGDQLRLRQVITNLIGNALKFTEKGHVEIRVTSGEKSPAGNREITFTVADTGIGIPETKRHLLFNSFSQVDDSHSRKFGGTGLGLAISREIVERMGGAISVDSTEGQETVFTFTIPLAEGAAEIEAERLAEKVKPAIKAAAPASEGKKRRLLLAEDDPVTRQVLGLMLKHSAYDHDIAENGIEAIEMWENENYDLILMDVQMPGKDGFAATGVIREREKERGGHTIIVAMTAHAFQEDEQRCLDAGMDAYIPKPIDLKKCMAVIEGLVGGRDSA